MIVPEQKSYRHGDENLLPMINVVFLLLIFFMVSGVITAADRLAVTPVESEAGDESAMPEYTLLVDAEGQLAWQGEVVSRDDLKATLAPYLGENPDELVAVKADANLTADALFDLFADLNRAGVPRVRLLAQRQ